MVGRIMLMVAALIATVGLAQGQETQPKHHHKAATPPAAEKTAAPQDDAPLPDKVQKWFGNSVDNILTGADKALDIDGKK